MGGQGKRARAYSTQTLCDPDPGGMNEWRDSLLHIPQGGDLLKVHLEHNQIRTASNCMWDVLMSNSYTKLPLRVYNKAPQQYPRQCSRCSTVRHHSNPQSSPPSAVHYGTTAVPKQCFLCCAPQHYSISEGSALNSNTHLTCF